MTAITTMKSDTRFLSLPRNKTGLFAADTINEVIPTRNISVTVPPLSPQHRHNTSTSLLLASSEQNHHQLQQYRSSKNEIQRYYPIDKNHASHIDSTDDTRITLKGIRNGFRPSTVRHQKLRLTTATTQRNTNYHENKELPSKSAVIQSHSSAKLKSEIDQINNKLIKQNKELSKTLRFPNNRELDETSYTHSPLSYSLSQRESSASTALTANLIHQRFSSGTTNITTNTHGTRSAINDTSNRPKQILSGTVGPSSARVIVERNDNQKDTTNYQPTHTYQIPQQSNVGGGSIFLMDPPPLSSIRTRLAKYDRYSRDLKAVSCPFYVMYLTNLAVQQQQNKDDNNTNINETISALTMSSSVVRKVPVNSRTSTAYQKRRSARRRVNSPVSINTCSTIDDDHTTNSTSFTSNKRFQTKISTDENENSHILRDILRTSSWNHVKV